MLFKSKIEEPRDVQNSKGLQNAVDKPKSTLDHGYMCLLGPFIQQHKHLPGHKNI